jgi:putative phage-type endonuclease
MRRTTSPSPGSPEWIEQRRHGIFATDAATVCGRSPFSSPFDKFQELQGTSAPKIATDAMEWGTLLQPVVGAAWARKKGKKVRACPWTYWLDYPDIGSHYDFDVVGEPAILEVKTASRYASREWGEEDTAEVPEAYMLQAQHEMMCRPGIERCYLAVLIGGQKLQSYVVERDEEMIADLLRIESRFLARSQRGIPPEMDGSEAATAYLRNLSPRDDGTRVDLTVEVEALALAYLSAREQSDAVERQKAEIGNKIREAMADNAAGVGRMVKITFRNSKDRTVVNWQAAAEAAGAPTEPFTTTVPGNRPLVVTLLDTP